jgi:hypothetical protein
MAKVYILSESNQVKPKEIPLKGQTPLDQIFILRRLLDPDERRNRRRKEYSALNEDAIYDFFNQIANDLNSVLTEKQIPKIGKILLE